VDKQSWKLADGTEFNCWVSKGNHADQRSWVWSDLQKGSISYRIIGGGLSADWKPMTRIKVGDDGKLAITPDPNGKFGATEVVPRGRYLVQFKVGTEEFSAVTLEAD
jgi:hypothetical protein